MLLFHRKLLMLKNGAVALNITAALNIQNIPYPTRANEVIQLSASLIRLSSFLVRGENGFNNTFMLNVAGKFGISICVQKFSDATWIFAMSIARSVVCRMHMQFAFRIKLWFCLWNVYLKREDYMRLWSYCCANAPFEHFQSSYNYYLFMHKHRIH